MRKFLIDWCARTDCFGACGRPPSPLRGAGVEPACCRRFERIKFSDGWRPMVLGPKISGAPGRIASGPAAPRPPLRCGPPSQSGGVPIACGDWSNSACLSVGSSNETTWAIPASRWFSARKSVVRPERFELPTTWFEARCSIQLSYGRSGASLAERRPGSTLLYRHGADIPDPGNQSGCCESKHGR